MIKNNRLFQRYYCLVLMVAISGYAFGQYTIRGIILDSLDRTPVPFAMVFIDGTTKGTTSNESGLFQLENVPLPSRLVVAHTSYLPCQIEVDGHTRELNISLKERNLRLSEAVVMDKSRRNDNLREFRRWFLGDDRWGSKAVLENDSVLMFQRHYDPDKIIQGSILSKLKGLSTLYATSFDPLIIDMPSLGYKLHVVLVRFTLHEFWYHSLCSSLGYFYYQPYSNSSAQKTKLYEKNRQSVYYNSSQHFCRSLYGGTLAQNGYKLMEKTVSTSGEEKSSFVDLTPFIISSSSKEQIQLIGLKGKQYSLLYYTRLNGTPKDLTIQRGGSISQRSEVYFLQDTCIIRSDGSIPDNSIVFDGEISLKRVGSSLPDDYIHEK